MRVAFLLVLAVLLTQSQAWSQVSLPLKQLRITSPYGNRVHPVTGLYCFHSGVDLKAHHDTVFSVLDGRVGDAGYNVLLGIFIKIKSGPFLITYGHLSQCFVNKGDSLVSNDPIGITGSTGRVTGEHLHLSIQFYREYLDPLAFLSAAEIIINHKKEN